MTLDEFMKLPGAKVHDGGERPVPLGEGVDVLLRDGCQARVFGDDPDDWAHYGMRADIIAYREVQP